MYHPQASVLDHIEVRLAIGLDVEKRKLERRRLSALLRELTPMKFRITEPVFFFGKQREPGEIMEAPMGPYRQVVEPGGLRNVAQFVEIPRELPRAQSVQGPPRMNAVVERLKAKALLARGIAGEAIRSVEGEFDSIIAEKEVIKTRLAEAAAPHHEIIAGVKGEIEGLKSAIDLLGNGGPPLTDSEKKEGA